MPTERISFQLGLLRYAEFGAEHAGVTKFKASSPLLVSISRFGDVRFL